MSDRIVIRDLAINCIVGVFEHERETPQVVRLDIEIDADAASVAKRDELGDGVDYFELARAIEALVVERRFRLIETMAEEVARLALDRFGVGEVLVRVKKPDAIANAACVEVEVRRVREAVPWVEDGSR